MTKKLNNKTAITLTKIKVKTVQFETPIQNINKTIIVYKLY